MYRETTGGSSGLMVYNRDHRNSAFESYKKPTSPSDIKQPSTEGEEKNDSAHARWVRAGLVTVTDVKAPPQNISVQSCMRPMAFNLRPPLHQTLNYIDLWATSYIPGGASAIIAQSCPHAPEVSALVMCHWNINNVWGKILWCVTISETAANPSTLK